MDKEKLLNMLGDSIEEKIIKDGIENTHFSKEDGWCVSDMEFFLQTVELPKNIDYSTILNLFFEKIDFKENI